MISALALLTAVSIPTELGTYIKKPDSSYAYSVARKREGLTELNLTSQTWQGVPWKHSVVVAQTEFAESADTAILYITGDRVEDKDLTFIRRFAEAANIPVVTLFDVPNQPIFDAREDALIAFTFGKYMETRDASWPLLFPMTKSAIRTMDAVQSWSKGRIKKFVVCGASKRGWTTWLTGASGDKRVVGIAPMVIDILNMEKQLAYQLESWGRYSPEIDDYVRTGLVKSFSVPEGQRLMRMVDPYSYLPSIKIPTLVIVGTNDRYWTVDAHKHYWNEIKGPKLMRVIPNVGHNLGGGVEAASSIAYFARCLAGRIPGGLPKVPPPPGDHHFLRKAMWEANRPDKVFHDAKWAPRPGTRGAHRARFTEYRFSCGGLEASFTTPVKLESF